IQKHGCRSRIYREESVSIVPHNRRYYRLSGDTVVGERTRKSANVRRLCSSLLRLVCHLVMNHDVVVGFYHQTNHGGGNFFNIIEDLEQGLIARGDESAGQ